MPNNKQKLNKIHDTDSQTNSTLVNQLSLQFSQQVHLQPAAGLENAM